MQLNGKRSYGKIASLPPEVRNAVDNMILTCTVRLPEIQAYIEEQAGVDVSTSTISRYGKRLSETYRDLTIAQENFEALRKEVEKYPEQDSAEILTRIASHKMMAALVSKSDKDWNEMRADKLLKKINGLTRAMAYKQRVDILNKDVVSAALDEVQASVFSALADEKRELYRQVVQFLDKKRKEGAVAWNGMCCRPSRVGNRTPGRRLNVPGLTPGCRRTPADPQAGPMDRTRIHAPAGLCIRWDGF